MDEKVLEEIQFHQETVAKDANSPLHLIREKEMEISGRVLAAKQEAESIVADARRRAVEVATAAEDESKSLSADHERKAFADVEKEIEGIKASAEQDVTALEGTISERLGKAVTFVVKRITEV